MRRIGSAIAVVAVVAACTSVPPSEPPKGLTSAPTIAPSFGDWASLETPLRLPPRGSGPCPRTAGTVVSPAFGPGLGAGPIYPVGLGAEGILHTVPDPAGRIQKVLWVGSPDYQGPVLVRGASLDGGGDVSFALGQGQPTLELRLTASTARSEGQGAWREWPSSTVVPAVGCYAYQVDGLGFRQVIIFEATT